MKKLLVLVMAVAMLLSMFACTTQQPASPEEPAAPTDATEPAEEAAATEEPAGTIEPKVAFIIPGPISDMSWCYTAYLGSEMVREAGYEVTYQENVTADMLVESVRTFASEGYNCILIATDANQEDIVETAKDFPDTQVFIVNGAYTSENVYPIFFADEDQGFVMGAIAGAITKTNKVAYIAGIDFVPLINGGKGFEAGVKYVNPDCEVFVTIAGTTEDVAMVKETAKNLFENGYDVIAPNADQASLGVMEAAGEVEGAMAIANGDGMLTVAPENTVTAVIMNTAVGYYAAFEQFRTGTIPTEIKKYGVADGLVEMPDWNSDFFAPLTDDQIASVQAAYDALRNGEVSINLD